MLARLGAVLCVISSITLAGAAHAAVGRIFNPGIFCGAIPPKICQGLCARNEFATTLKFTRTGDVYWEGQLITPKALKKHLDRMSVEYSYFVIAPDNNTPYGAVARLLLELQRRHFDSVLCDVPKANQDTHQNDLGH
jgi:hypothetical protein